VETASAVCPEGSSAVSCIRLPRNHETHDAHGVFARRPTFPKVVITAHPACYAEEALTAISETTLANITAHGKDGAWAISVFRDEVRGESVRA